MTVVAVLFVSLFSLGYIIATGYLIVRDDLIGTTIARQTRMQHDYEDRIAVLRAQLDRATSRQLMARQLVEDKMDQLLAQQDTLSLRHGKLGALLDRAGQSGLSIIPEASSTGVIKTAGEDDGHRAIAAALGHAGDTNKPVAPLAYAPLRQSVTERAERIFSTITQSLERIEQEQLATITDITQDADETTTAISDIIKTSGVDVAPLAEPDAEGLGGPFVEPETTTSLFDNSLTELDMALSRLESVRETARALPYGNPAPGRKVTSHYGNRIDPFLGRLALHAGIDFRAKKGVEVFSTGAGKVTFAASSGGYGKMVEIDHGHGITTRYGHLSKILVSSGDTIAAGDPVGRAGSTGRSTGPHVHYEVRRNGKPVNPVHFLNAGMKLETYLN